MDRHGRPKNSTGRKQHKGIVFVITTSSAFNSQALSLNYIFYKPVSFLSAYESGPNGSPD